MSTINIGNTKRTVVLAGYDITEWVTILPTTPKLKPEWGSIPSPPSLSVVCRTDDNALNPLHPASLLYGARLDTFQLTVTQYDQVTWKGFLKDARTDVSQHRVTLECDSILNQSLNRSARIDTTTALTPANAVRDLLILHNIDYDPFTFARADALQDDVPMRVTVSPSVLDWQGTLGDLLKDLATAGVARIYIDASGAIGYDHFDKNISVLQSDYTIEDVDILGRPAVENDSSDIITGFDITYKFGTTTDTTGTEALSLDYGPESTIIIEDLASAIYCGDSWVAASNKHYYRVKLNVSKKHGLALGLNSLVHIDSESLAFDFIAEILGIDDGDNRWTVLTLRVDKTQL